MVPVKDQPEDANVVETLLQNYEDIRNNDVESFVNSADQKQRELAAGFVDNPHVDAGNEHQLPGRLENLHNTIADVVKEMDMKQIVRYVCISGADRNVRLNPKRSSFRTQLVEPLRNVSKVKVTFVQIPMESNTNVRNQSVFNYPLDVPFPYLLLQIDELQPRNGTDISLAKSLDTHALTLKCLITSCPVPRALYQRPGIVKSIKSWHICPCCCWMRAYSARNGSTLTGTPSLIRWSAAWMAYLKLDDS